MLTIRAMSDGKGYSSNHLEHSDYAESFARFSFVLTSVIGLSANQIGYYSA
jgi:hypothetical protein